MASRLLSVLEPVSLKTVAHWLKIEYFDLMLHIKSFQRLVFKANFAQKVSNYNIFLFLTVYQVNGKKVIDYTYLVISHNQNNYK